MVETRRRRGRGRRRRGAHGDADRVGLRADSEAGADADARGAHVRLLRVRTGDHDEEHGALAEHALQLAQLGQLLRTGVTARVHSGPRYR